LLYALILAQGGAESGRKEARSAVRRLLQVPDARTVWLFLERPKKLEWVEVPRQRNSREENAGIKAGESPEGLNPPPMALEKSNSAMGCL
jgi:hypothetical protein